MTDEETTSTRAFGCEKVGMGDSVCNEELGTADEVIEGVELLVKLTVFMPADASLATTANGCLCDDPATFHR